MGGKWSCYLKTTFQEFLWLAGLEKGKYLYTKPKEKILEKLENTELGIYLIIMNQLDKEKKL